MPRISPSPPLLPLHRSSDFSPATRRWLVAGVAGAHLLGVWSLLQVDSVRAAVHDMAPRVVELVAPERPEIPPPAPPVPPQRAPAPPQRVQPPTPQPFRPATTPAPLAAETFSSAAPPPDATVAAVATIAPPPAPASPPAPPSPPAPATPPASPPRKLIPATAVRYQVEPVFELPRASRRAGEHGTVVLRVVVGVQGLPLAVNVHRSSGYPRLDEQALGAMRKARFKPYTEDGRALEVEALAPVEYPLE